MVEEALVMEQLTSEMIESGRELVLHLAQEGTKIKTAMWLYTEATGRWRLVLASPDVRHGGPLAIYSRASKQLARMGNPDYLPVYRIAIVDPKSSDIPLPTGSAGTVRGLAGQRVTDDWIGGVHVDDAYVYRVAPRRSRATA